MVEHGPGNPEGWLERVLVPGVGLSSTTIIGHGGSHQRSAHHRHLDLRSPRLHVKARTTTVKERCCALRMNTAVLTRRSWLALYGLTTARQTSRSGSGAQEDAVAVKAYVVYCHPDPGSSTAALRVDSAACSPLDISSGSRTSTPTTSIRRCHVRTLEHRAPPPPPPDIAEYCRNLQWCDMLVFVYPTWWSAQRRC
jgi:hypothetical protein